MSILSAVKFAASRSREPQFYRPICRGPGFERELQNVLHYQRWDRESHCQVFQNAQARGYSSS